MRNPIFVAVSAAMVVALIVGGCGDSSAAPTRAAFIMEADAICEEADREQVVRLQAAAKKNSKMAATPAGQEKLVMTVGLPPIQSEAEELSELSVPDGDEGELAAVVAGIEKAVAAGEEDPALIIDSPTELFADVDKLARDYGFKACSDAG